MANGIEASKGLSGTFEQWLTEAKIPEKEIDRNQDGKADGSEAISYVLSHLAKFSPQVQKEVDALRQVFRALGFVDQETDQVLSNKDSKKLIAKGEDFEKSASEKKAAGEEQVGKALLDNAEKAYRMAADLDSGSAQAYRHLADLEFRQGRSATAQQDAKRAIQLAPADDLNAMLTWLKGVDDPQLKQNAETFLGSALVEAHRYPEARNFYAGLAAQTKDSARAQKYLEKSWWVEEIEHPYRKNLKNGDLAFADLAIALQARGIPAAALDGRGGPAYQVPDGVLTERDLLFYVGTNYEKNPDLQAAMKDAGIDEGKFFDLYNQTLRAGLKEDMDRLKEAAKTGNLLEMKRLTEAADVRAFDLDWQDPGSKERIENIKVLRSYYKGALAVSKVLGEDADKQSQYQDALSSLDSQWATLVKNGYPGADGLDGHGFLKEDQVADATVRIRASLQQYQESHAKKDSEGGDLTHTIATDRETLIFLSEHTEFPLLPLETQNQILSDFSINQFPNPNLNLSDEARVGYAFYLKGDQAEARGNWSEAAGFYAQALDHSPDNEKFGMAAARANFAAGQFQSSDDYVMPQKLFQQAALQIDAVIAKHPDFTEALKLSGEIQMALGNAEGAQHLFEKALEIEEGKWFQDRNEDQIQSLKDDFLKAGKLSAAQLAAFPPQVNDVRSDDKTLNAGYDGLVEWIGLASNSFGLASEDVSLKSLAEVKDSTKQLQSLLLKKHVAPEQVSSNYSMGAPLPSAADYQEYAFAHFAQFRKEIEQVYGPLPFDSEGKLDASVQSKAEDEWKAGAADLKGRLKSAGLQPGSPNFERAFQLELQKPENAGLRALQIMLSTEASPRLRAMALAQYGAAQKMDLASRLAKSADASPKDAEVARRAYESSAQSYEQAFRLSQKPKDAKAAAMSYFAAANLAKKQGDELAAKHLFLKGAAILQGMRNLPYPNGLFQDGEALELMGHALREAGKYPEALQMYSYAYAAGDRTDSLKEGVAFVNKYEFSLEHVDPKFLKRFEKLEAKEEKGTLNGKEGKELSQMRRGLEMLKQVNQDFFPGWTRSATDAIAIENHHEFYEHGIRPVGAATLRDQWEVMQENELPVVRYLRQDILASLKLPQDGKYLTELEGKVDRLGKAAETLRQVDLARQEVLKKYPSYVQDEVLETGNWSLMKMHYEEKVDNFGQNWEDIPPEWNPGALNKLAIWTSLSDPKTGDPAALENMQQVMAVFGNPSLVPSDTGSLSDLEASVSKIQGLVFKTETHLEPNSGNVVAEAVMDPASGRYLFNSGLERALDIRENISPEDKPSAWIRDRAGAEMKQLATTKGLLKSLDALKQEVHQTKEELKQAQAQGDTLKVQELQGKLDQLNEKTAKLVENSQTVLKEQAKAFNDIQEPYFTAAVGAGVGVENEGVFFAYQLQDAQNGIQGWDKEIAPFPKDSEQALEELSKRFQTMAGAHAVLLKSLVASNEAITRGESAYDYQGFGEYAALDQAMGFNGLSIDKVDLAQVDIGKVLEMALSSVQSSDAELARDLPKNLREGIDAQLENWEKVRADMGNDYRVGEVEALIAKYKAAQTALENGDEHKALSLFQLATDSKNLLLAQDAYKEYKKWESIKSLALELAIVAVATVITGGAAAALAPEIMAAEGIGALIVEGTTFTVVDKGIRAGLYYGADVGENPFKDAQGNWLMPWDYLYEDAKNIAMFGVLKGAGRAFRFGMLADQETKALVEEAFTLSEGRVGGKVLSKSEYVSKALDLRAQAKIAQMGFFRKMGFKAGEFAVEATTMQLWNNASVSLDVLYQDLVHDRKLDWGQQVSQANSEDSILHGLVFLVGTKISGFLTHPSIEGISTKKSKEAKQLIQNDLSFQTQMAFQKRAADFQARMVAYDADPQFKYLNEKDRADAKKLIALGDQTYLPETKKGHDIMDTTFLTADQKAWLEMRDLLNASIRYSEVKGAPTKEAGPKEKAAPQPMPASDSAPYAALVEGLLPYSSDRAPGPATRDAVKDWVQKNVPDQGKYQELLGDLAEKKKVLTVHDGKVTLEDNAKVQIRVQQAVHVYRNMAKKFGLDLNQSGTATTGFLSLAAGDPTFNPDKVEKNLDAVFKNLQPILKKTPRESQAKVREALFQEAIEGNLSVDRAHDLQGMVENGTAILVPGDGGTGYKVVAAILGTAAPLGSALLRGEDGAATLSAAPESGTVKVEVGGRSLELLTGTAANGDTTFSLRRVDGKGEVQIRKQGHDKPQALPGAGEPGIALSPGDVLIVDGKTVQYMDPMQVAHETAEREKTIQLGAEIESDRAALAKLPVDSTDRKTAEDALANKEAQYRFRLGASQQSSEDLTRLMGVDPGSAEGKVLVSALVDSAKAKGEGKRALHEELVRLSDFLQDWLKIDVDSEAGKSLLKQIATAMTNPELAPALLKRFPELERLRTELDTSTKQVLTRAGLDKVPGRETWRRDLVTFALERGWGADDLQKIGKVLAERPELLKNIVDSLDQNSSHPLSGTAKGKQWMGQFLLDAIQASPDSGSFAATLLNFEAQVRIQGDAADRIMLLQGQTSLDTKAAIFRQALSEGQKPLDWKNEVQLVANGEVEWRVENGQAIRIEYTLDEAAPRKTTIDQRMAQIEPLAPKPKEKETAKSGDTTQVQKPKAKSEAQPLPQADVTTASDKGADRASLATDDKKSDGTQVLQKKSKRSASTSTDQGNQEVADTAARNEVGQRTQDTIQSADDKTIQEPPPADKTVSGGSGGGRTGPSVPGGDSQGPTNPQRPRAGQLMSSDGLDSMTISVDREEPIRWSSADRKIPGDPWAVNLIPRGDEKYELVPEEGKVFYKVGNDWFPVFKQGFVLEDGMQLKLGDIEFTWRQPGGETGSAQATNSRQAEEMLAETLFQYYSDPDALKTLKSFAGRSDDWGTQAKAFQEGMAELQIGYDEYSKLKEDYRRDPSLPKREALNQKWAEVQKNSELLHLSKYHQMETDHTWTIKNLEGKLGTLSNFFGMKEFETVQEGRIDPNAPARMSFRLDFQAPENLSGYEGVTKNVSADRMVRGKLEVRSWEEAKNLVAEMGKTKGLEIVDPLKIGKKAGSLTVMVDGATRIEIDVSLVRGSEAAQEAHLQEETRIERDTLRAMEAEIEGMKARQEDPGKIADMEKILEESKKTYFDSLAQRQLSSDGVPYRELMPKIVESATADVFSGKVTPQNRGELRDAILSDLAAKGIRVSTDNAKAIDSMIDIALTAKAHGLIDQPGGITKEQFYALMGDLYLHNNPVVRIGAAELTHVPMVVEGSLNHYEGMAQARGEKASVSEKKAIFLAALLHDAGKWDPNIRTQTGYTILKTSFFNKTGADIVVKPGQSLKEALAEQKLDPAQVTLPFDGMTAILVHHDAKTVRSSVKRLVELGILEPVEAQRVWEAIQYHGFVSSWIVVNSLSGMGIKSHVFNDSYDKQLKPYLEAFQKVSKRMGEAGIPDLPTLMKDPAFAGDVAKMRTAFDKLPHYVQALMLGDHQGQIDIAKYMGILSMPAKDASIYDLFFGDSMTNSVLGVLRTHSYEQTLLSPDQGHASASAFTAAEGWLKQSDPQQPGLAKAILADKDLVAKYEQWRAGEGKGGSVQDWLKTLKVKADGKNSSDFTKIQGLVEKSFYDFYTKDPSKPLDWRSAQEAEQNYQALPAKTRKLIDLFSAPYEVDGNWIHADIKPIVDLIDSIGPKKIESILEHGDISSQNLSRLLDIATNENFPDKAATARDFLKHASAEEIAFLTDSQAMMIDRIVNFKFNRDGKTLTGLDFLAMENPYQALQGIIGQTGNPEMERRLLGALALREFHNTTHTQEGLDFLAMFGIDPKTHDHFPWNVQDTLSRADLYVEVEQARRQMIADYQRVFPNLPKETIDGFVKDLWKTLRSQDVQDTHLPYTPHGWKHSLAVMEDSAKIFDQAGPVRDTIIAQLRPKYGDRAEAVARELVKFIGIFHDTGYGCLHPHEHKGLHAERSGDLFKKEFAEHMEKVFGIKADDPLFNEIFLAIERHGADKPGKAEYMRASDKENPFLFVIRMADNLDLTNRRMRQIQLNHPVMDALKEMYLRGESPDFKDLGDAAKKKEIQAIRDKHAKLFDQAVKDGGMSRGEAERNKKVLAQLNESTYPHFAGTEQVTGYRLIEDPNTHQLTVEIELSGWAKGQTVSDAGYLVDHPLYQVLRTYIAAQSMTYGTGPDGRGLPIEFRYRETFRATTPDGHDLPLLPDNVVEFKPAKKGEPQKPPVVKQEGIGLHDVTPKAPSSGTPDLPAAAAGGPDVPQRLADDEAKSNKLPSIAGILDTGSQSLPGAMIVPHQPGVSGYPFSEYRKLTVDTVDAENGVLTLSQEGTREKLRLEFDPKNPPPSLSDFIPGMEVDVLHGGGGTAFPNRGRFQSIQTSDLQFLQSLPKLPIAEGILNGGDPKVQLTSKVEAGGYTFYMTDVIHVHTSKESREYVLALVAVPQADGSLRLERRTFTKSNSGTGWVAMTATLAGGRHFKGGGSYTVEIQLAPEVVDHLVEKENRDQQRVQQQQVTMTVDEINENYTNAGNRYTYENPQSPDWRKGRRIGNLASEDVTNFAHSVTLDRPSELESLWKLQPGKVLRGARDADDEALAKGIPGWQWKDVVPRSLSELQHYLDHIQYPEGFIPDFTQQPLKTYQRHQSVLGDFTCYEFGGAKLGGRDLIWTMALDSQGRTWVQSVRYADAKPNSYGVYSEALDIGILASKPLEYDHQAEVLRNEDREHRYFRPTNSRYVDITPMLGQLEPMRRFKQAMGVSEPIYDHAPLKSPLELKPPAGKDRVVIGRNPQVSDVVLHDAQASKTHAVAQKGDDGHWYLMDGYVDAQGRHQVSRNGVKSRQLVENRDGSKDWQWVPVGRENWYRLTPGEYLKIGDTQMVFHPPVEAAPQADSTKASSVAADRPNVEVALQAPPGKKSFTVGRNGAAVDMSFNDAGMSRVHATFYRTDDGKWWVLDGGFDSSGRQVPSKNGISTLAADGQEFRLSNEGWVEVQPGQHLKMGDHWFTFQPSESASPGAPDANAFQAVETGQGQAATPFMDWAGFSDRLGKNEIAISQLAPNVEELNLFVGDTNKIDPKADLSVVVDDGATRGDPTFWGKLRREGDHWIYYPAERIDAQGVQDRFYQPKAPRPDGWIELSEGDRLSIGFADFRMEGGKLVQAEDLSNLSVSMVLHNPDEVLGAARGTAANYVEPVFSHPNYDPQAEILSGNIDLSGLIPITVHPAEEGRGEIAMATTQGAGYGKSNEDVVMTVRGPKGETILLDIDGMGGHGNGDKAALLIAEAFAAEIPRSGDTGTAWQLANTAVRRFNGAMSEGKNAQEAMDVARALITDPASQIDGKMNKGAGAVAVQMTLDPPSEPGGPQMAHFHWAGDGRAMILNRDPQGNWRWVYRTVDEGFPSTPGVLEPGRDYQVGGGRRTLAMALHPQSNVVVNSVGGDSYLQTRGTEHGEIPSQRDPKGATAAGPDLVGGFELEKGDMVLLGSDGFWENFGSTKVIQELLRPAQSAEDATKILSDETHWRMGVLAEAKAGTLPEVIPGLYRIDRPEGIVYTDLRGNVQRAKTLYIDAWGQVYDSPNGSAPVDHYKNDNFSLMTYLHNPVEPRAPRELRAPDPKDLELPVRDPSSARAAPQVGEGASDLLSLDARLEQRKQNLIESAYSLGDLHGRLQPPSSEEVAERLYQVLDRGQPLELVTSEGGLRQSVDEYMVGYVHEFAKLYPKEIDAAKGINPYTGENLQSRNQRHEEVIRYDALYRFVRMRMNEKLGHPIFGEPSFRQKVMVENFVTRALKRPITNYDLAKQELRDSALKLTPEFRQAFTAANPDLRVSLISALVDDQRSLSISGVNVAMSLVEFVGKSGLDRELGVAVDLGKSPPQYSLVLGNWDQISHPDPNVFFLIHSHTKFYLNPQGRVMGVQDTMISSLGKEIKRSATVLPSNVDLNYMAGFARELVKAGKDLPPFYDAATRTLSAWVQHPYGLSEIKMHVDEAGKVQRVDVRYGFYEPKELDATHRNRRLALESWLREKFPGTEIKVKNLPVSELESEMPSKAISNPAVDSPAIAELGPADSAAGDSRSHKENPKANQVLGSLSFGPELVRKQAEDPQYADQPLKLLNAFLRGDLGREPTFQEVEELRKAPGVNWRSGDLGDILTKGGKGIGPQVFQIYTKEFLDAMASSLEKQVLDFEAKYRKSPAIFEIAAGDGRLTEALNRRLAPRGIHIRATDVHESHWNISFGTQVEKMDAAAAAQQGDILIASWLPHDVNFDVDVAKQLQKDPKKSLILIGEGYGGDRTSSRDFLEFVNDPQNKIKIDLPDELNLTAEGERLPTSRLGLDDRETTAVYTFQYKP